MVINFFSGSPENNEEVSDESLVSCILKYFPDDYLKQKS